MIETRISTTERRAPARRYFAAAPAPLAPSLMGYLERLGQLLPALDESASRAAMHALDALLATAQQSARFADSEASVESARRRAALRHIERHLDAPQLSPASVAASLGLSVRQLHRSFEQRSGPSISATIRHLRAERARALVETCRRLPITDIALQCGFASLASFYRVFKAEFGMTASEARERAGSAAGNVRR